jgi:quercetin dioxygenase-like cupin family protein
MRAFKNYGIIDVSQIKKILNNENFDWDEFNFRQNRGKKTHQETKSIPIIFDESFSIKVYNEREHYNKFKDELKKIENHIREILDEDGYIFRALLVNLPKKKSIPKHKDTGESLVVPRRIHIPIQTNENCFFTVGEIKKNLKEGEIWEIDNAGQLHSVENNGDEDRIHLIVDFLRHDYVSKERI